ncbi:MAG: glycosyltransferase family 4 protein [Clostridiales bacterium]|jgi:glycosyltransferase involved in cell wall biosynthesis|nr:glycosyltransferase family 4 protein [Clostridiales bacterium]
MKIIVATPILYDPTSPFNHLFRDILQGFLDAGHSVTRIAAVEKGGQKEYRLGIDHPEMEYIEVQRKKTQKQSVIKRYLADNLTNIKMAWKIWRAKKGDVLFEDVSYSSIWSVWAARARRIRVVSMIQDVWPDNAVESGLLSRGSMVYRFFDCIQKKVYRKSEKIICISDDIKAFIASKGVPADRIDVIYNWGYQDDLIKIDWNENKFVQKYRLSPDLFYAVYAGNIGKMQNVDLIVDAARRLKDQKHIRFLIVGGGVRRDEIEEKINRDECSNVTMLPMQPSELATHIYSMADVNLIPLVKGGIKTALPSKTGVCLSCGRPIVACVDADALFAKAVLAEGAGYVVEPDDSKGLSDLLLRLAEKDREESCEGAYGCFQRLFRRKDNVDKYVKAIAKGK